MDAQKQNLRDYLFENLSAKGYSLLPEFIGVSDTKMSRLLSGTDAWECDTFKRLVKAIISIHPHELLQRFELKNSITINEMDAIVKEYETQKK